MIKLRKIFKLTGCLQVIVGIALGIVFVVSGGTLILPIIGGYLVCNGTMNYIIQP